MMKAMLIEWKFKFSQWYCRMEVSNGNLEYLELPRMALVGFRSQEYSAQTTTPRQVDAWADCIVSTSVTDIP